MWAVGRDRLRTATEVGALAGSDPSIAAIEAFLSIQVALSAIDRLEVRGRDSAGLHLLVRHHGLDLDEPAVGRLVAARADDPLFGSGSVRAMGDAMSFVYKAAAEIGELGDNTAVLRAAIRDDPLLHLALADPAAEVMVLGHTRWASVGIISEANADPLNHEELDGDQRPYVVGALNGDVDNYADLKALEQLQVPAEITTDAKVIPALVSRRLAAGGTVEDAFRTTVSELAGSMGIAAQTAAAPDELLLSLRGSGQALYVGLVEDAFVVASEPYGLVEETATYLRMDGETPADPERAAATRGQVVVLDAEHAGTLEGIRRFAFDGTPLPVTPDELQHAEITTRDIDRGDFPHFLLKEISEAPASFRKTLRGKVVERDGQLDVALGPDTLPDDVRGACATAASAGSWSSARAPRPSPARAWPPSSPRSPTTSCAPTPSSPPSSRASSCATTCPTRWSSPSARAAPPPTPTGPPTWRAPAAPPSCRSSTGATATWSTSPTGCSTRPTDVTWRWRCRPPRRSTRRSRPGRCWRSRWPPR